MHHSKQPLVVVLQLSKIQPSRQFMTEEIILFIQPSQFADNILEVKAANTFHTIMFDQYKLYLPNFHL